MLRAPTVTPRDEEMRPSGTLQSPTTGSLEAMIIESDREEQLAQVRRLPRNAVVNLPDVEPGFFSPGASEVARQQAPAAKAGNVQTVAQSPTSSTSQANVVAATQPQRTPAEKPQIEELPSYVPAPKSLVSDRSAEQLALVNTGVAGNQNAALTSLPKPIETSTTPVRNNVPAAQLNLSAAAAPFKIGEKRLLAIQLNTDAPVGLAILMLRFDPKVVKLSAVNPGTLLPPGNKVSLTQSIDPKGMYVFSLSTFNGSTPLTGAGSLVLIQAEAIADGDAAFGFDKESLRLITADSRDISVEVTPVRGTTK